MESSNLHDHQHDQLQAQLGESSSHSATPCYQIVGTTPAWTTPNTILNNVNFNPNINATSMIQDMGIFQWSGLSAHDLQLARIKEELSDSYPKFNEMLDSPSSSIQDSHLPPFSSYNIKNKGIRDLNMEMGEKVLLKTFSSGCQINALQLPAGGDQFYSNAPSRGTYSQIYPTINISNFNQIQASSAISSSSDMNLEALDLFNSGRFGGGFSLQPSHDHLGLFKNSLSCTSLDNMQQIISHRPSNTPANNGVTEVKRSSSFLDPKAAQATLKKSRVESRSSCAPIKVRKEKLGDRIAALQQLVAPFGKTDTASVLMEAIGYIKFLQNQVETLSVPYMKRNKTCRKMQRGSSGEDGQEEPMRDLKSRGLCLVPLSCLTYVTDGGGGVWPPPNFSGNS